MKLEGVEVTFSQLQDKVDVEFMVTIETVKEALFAVYDEYARLHRASVPSYSSPTTVSPNEKGSSTARSNILSILRKKRQPPGQSSTTTQSELKHYLDASVLVLSNTEISTFEILMWWKSVAVMYPILSKLALDILTPPASTVASESAFSAGGLVITKKRHSLGEDLLEALVCSRDWYLSERKLEGLRDPEEDDVLGDISS